jgi:heme/copper-type cytochrome/quinol oxidase subunit 3
MTESAVLREPWPDLAQQREGASFGIWVFIATEILFFGALFLGYAVYRSLYPDAFRLASEQTELFYGALNTVLLLTSSFTMTVAVRGAALGFRRTALICLIVTALLGCCFLVGKGLEYHDDLTKNLFPGAQFPLQQAQTQIFWAFYWVMTGIHAIHLTIGIVVVAVVTVMLCRRTLTIGSPTVTVVALYWHFVDAIWITLVPLLYMAGHR